MPSQWSISAVVLTSDEHIVWWYIVIPNIVSFSKYRINIVIAFFLDNITRYCMHVILVYFSLSWTCESKMTFKISYGLTYNSMNWSNLCICYTFEEWNFVYCTVFSRISRKCRNFCDLRAYFTKWEISCNIVWLSYQNPKYRVISCGPKKKISLMGGWGDSGVGSWGSCWIRLFWPKGGHFGANGYTGSQLYCQVAFGKTFRPYPPRFLLCGSQR